MRREGEERRGQGDAKRAERWWRLVDADRKESAQDRKNTSLHEAEGALTEWHLTHAEQHAHPHRPHEVAQTPETHGGMGKGKVIEPNNYSRRFEAFTACAQHGR